jgi:hypothetical protein
MTRDKTTDPAMPRTLAEAHHAVASIRPPQNAPLADWLAYHQQSAAVYAEVAEIDRGHHHEALFMAEHARQQAKDIKAWISSQHATAGKE